MAAAVTIVVALAACAGGDGGDAQGTPAPGLRRTVEDAVEDELAGLGDPGLGRKPRCWLPPRGCAGSRRACRGLVEFAPRRGRGYDVTTLPGEENARRSSSWVRRDLMMLVKYAAAKVECEAAGWPGAPGPLELGDMSQRSGQTPGSWDFAPRHPPRTHEQGTDIDVAYYQAGTAGNRIRAICPHRLAGYERLHCIGPPTTLDAMRTALFIGALLEEPIVRAVGVDGQAGPRIEAALRRLCGARWIRAIACRRIDAVLVYETADTGLGWYFAHHHHVHVGTYLP
jgi:hypothetical protein